MSDDAMPPRDDERRPAGREFDRAIGLALFSGLESLLVGAAREASGDSPRPFRLDLNRLADLAETPRRSLSRAVASLVAKRVFRRCDGHALSLNTRHREWVDAERGLPLLTPNQVAHCEGTDGRWVKNDNDGNVMDINDHDGNDPEDNSVPDIFDPSARPEGVSGAEAPVSWDRNVPSGGGEDGNVMDKSVIASPVAADRRSPPAPPLCESRARIGIEFNSVPELKSRDGDLVLNPNPRTHAHDEGPRSPEDVGRIEEATAILHGIGGVAPDVIAGLRRAAEGESRDVTGHQFLAAAKLAQADEHVRKKLVKPGERLWPYFSAVAKNRPASPERIVRASQMAKIRSPIAEIAAQCGCTVEEYAAFMDAKREKALKKLLEAGNGPRAKV